MGAEGADLPQHPLKNKGWFLTNPLPEIPRFFRIAVKRTEYFGDATVADEDKVHAEESK